MFQLSLKLSSGPMRMDCSYKPSFLAAADDSGDIKTIKVVSLTEKLQPSVTKAGVFCLRISIELLTKFIFYVS
ncbi:hypothetical protein GIB67_018301 [Kingdonia uniflora]|uniref:Uncharacterized protein n=1 Tax=Kingdonia uniflora TaxID=39325 RepID=A0A7J7MJA6_9MAGN|nr:hypothetical protein GIB67_018301 [Kingdonia uniflora]